MSKLDTRSESGRKVAVLKTGDRIHRMDKDRIVLGSVVSSDLQLTGDGVSPIHAVIEIAPDQTADVWRAQIFDLASVTGLFINGKKIITSELSSGDEITIGRHKVTFSLEPAKKVREELTQDRIRRSDQGSDLFYNPNEDLRPLLLEDERKVREIFDYRPSRRQALEVVMSFGETILNIEHFVREREVTIGPLQKHDFGIPAWLSTSKYPLVRREGDRFVLNLDRNVMRGILQSDGKLLDLSTLPGAQVKLGPNDFAKIEIGDVAFYLSYTAAPPRLKPEKWLDSDPLFSRLYFTSLFLSALVIYGIFTTKFPDHLEAEPVPERIATILYQPQKPPPPPQPKVPKEKEPEEKPPVVVKPKPEPTKRKVDLEKSSQPPKDIPKEMVARALPKAKPVAKSKTAVAGTKNTPAQQQGQAAAKEGEGARAKGPSGTRGEPSKAPDKVPQTAAKRPSPQGGLGRGGGESQVRNDGNVDFLKSYGGKIENILGNAGAQLGKGGEKLKGFGGFSTQGSGGLALSGTGSGGGGTAEGLGGLGSKGQGGGRVGTGKGAAGSGSGIVGGQARVAIRSGGPEEVVVMGAIDADAVNAALLAHKDEFLYCYEKEINAENPGLGGTVNASWVIGPSGRATKTAVTSSSLKNATVEACVLKVLSRIEFPQPRGGGEVSTSKPFKFYPLSKK